MQMSLKAIVVGALALAGATVATAEAQAMPIGPLAPAASEAHVDQVYYYGYRRPFVRRFVVRPYGYYGYRRFGYGYGFRRPLFGYRRFGYGYRRF